MEKHPHFNIERSRKGRDLIRHTDGGCFSIQIPSLHYTVHNFNIQRSSKASDLVRHPGEGCGGGLSSSRAASGRKRRQERKITAYDMALKDG
jgi:hypothetical protein